MRRFLVAILVALTAGAAGYVIGSRAMLRRVERWHSRIYATGESPVAAVSGYARYSRISACRPFGGERWRIAFDERYVCHVERQGREAILHLGPDGSPQAAQVSWRSRTAAEALFEGDSVRRAFTAQGGELCPSQGTGRFETEIWTVGAVRAIINVDTTQGVGPRVTVHAIDSTLSPCAALAESTMPSRPAFAPPNPAH